jgi:hypothetical protein
MTRSTLIGHPESPRGVHGCAGGPNLTLPTTRQSNASLVQIRCSDFLASVRVPAWQRDRTLASEVGGPTKARRGRGIEAGRSSASRRAAMWRRMLVLVHPVRQGRGSAAAAHRREALIWFPRNARLWARLRGVLGQAQSGDDRRIWRAAQALPGVARRQAVSWRPAVTGSMSSAARGCLSPEIRPRKRAATKNRWQMGGITDDR